MGRPLLLFFWPLLPLLSLRPSPRLMPTPTFCMEDMVWDTLAMLDTLAMELTMESVKLKLSPRLMPTPTFCMVDIDILDMVDMVDTMDMVWDTDTMASVKLSLRLMPTPTFSTEDTMDMVLDMPDTMVLDTMVLDTDFMESALLMPSQKLTPTFCMEDMPDTMDTPMVDMPTLDKLFPLISKWTANHPCFLHQ